MNSTSYCVNLKVGSRMVDLTCRFVRTGSTAACTDLSPWGRGQVMPSEGCRTPLFSEEKGMPCCHGLIVLDRTSVCIFSLYSSVTLAAIVLFAMIAAGLDWLEALYNQFQRKKLYLDLYLKTTLLVFFHILTLSISLPLIVVI